MTNYAFQSKEVAEALSRVGKEAMRGVSSGIAPTGREHIYAKVPAEGIDGRSDTTCASGVCTLVRFVTGELIEKADTNVEVYNVTETDLEAGAYIEVFRVGAFWVFDSGGGGAIKTFQSSSAITGRNQNTAGTGTAVSYTYDDTSNLFVLGTENPPYNIINPYSLQVSQGIVIQCKPCDGGKWEIVQAECETPEEETP